MTPTVSIVVPCYNEQATIGVLLDALWAQTYPRALIEVVIADGLSTDNTRNVISDFQRLQPDLDVIVIDNPKRFIPTAINLAIKASHGEITLILSAHSRPHPNYIELCVCDLVRGVADNVGGVCIVQPKSDGFVAKSIALAAAHPFGVGDAKYRYSTKPTYVDTVAFGSFKRSLFDQIGMYDETLLTNEDYEFNSRIRERGGKIWLNPDIKADYYSRSSFTSLARQYWRYGFWKWRMLRKHPSTLRWRQALPPLFVLNLLLLAVLSLLSAIAQLLLLTVVIPYLGILLAAGIMIAIKHHEPLVAFGLPLAISVMHVSWGSGFIWSFIQSGVSVLTQKA